MIFGLFSTKKFQYIGHLQTINILSKYHHHIRSPLISGHLNIDKLPSEIRSRIRGLNGICLAMIKLIKA